MKGTKILTDYYQLAVEFFNSGKLSDAESCLKKLIQNKRNDFDAYNFLGIINLKRKNYEEAVKNFLKVIELKPNHPNVNYNLGLSYQALGKTDFAVDCFEKFLFHNEDNVDTLINLALLYLIKEKYDSVESIYSKAIKLFPNDERVLLNYSNFLIAKERYSELLNILVDEEKIFNKEISNEIAGFLINRSKALLFNGQAKESLKLLQKIYLYRTDIPDLILSLANVYLVLNENEKAHEYYVKLIDTDLSAAGFNGLGLIELRKMDVEKAEYHFQRAIQKDENVPDYHYNLSHCLLLKGNLKDGFREYEWRKKRKEFVKRNFKKPELQTEEIYNKKILLWDEQGIGDIIQFIRYAKLLKQSGAEVYFHCASNVVSLFSEYKFVDKIIPRISLEEPDVDYDYHISLLSLPRFFNTTLDTIPDTDKYLNVEQAIVEKWRKYFLAYSTKKIGLVWAGNPKHNNDKNRSIALKNFERLFRNKQFTFFSLQKGAGLEQANEFRNEIIILDSEINSLNDTAAIIENLDLVISVDTSVAHLAGALGKKTFVLLPFSPDWRWLKEGTNSIWYKSMRLFRQKNPGDWESVIEEINKVLVENIDLESFVIKNVKKRSSGKIFLGLAKGENFGWGVCSKYLKKELHKKIGAESLDEYFSLVDEGKVEGIVFHGLTDLEFKSIYKVRGDKNYGYTFFENVLLPASVENSKRYEKVIGGSTWCKQKMEEQGISNTDVLIQGIDPEVFYPITTPTNEKLFVIFSGGKFELRKGQDLVLLAVRHMMQKYQNVVLINAWYNFWPESITTMNKSNYIHFDLIAGSWNDFMMNIYKKNGIDATKVFTLPITPNEKLRELYSKTDIGLFPNRCEGGTNLVMMEYMACGKPVVASFNSGHKDILNEENSLMIKNMKEFQVFENNKLVSDWEEPDLDEIISKLEYAYENRDAIKKIGENAGKYMMNYTWEKTAENLLKILKV